MDADFLLAIKLQEQFDSELESSLFPSNGFEGNGLLQSNKKKKVEVAGGDRWQPTVHPEKTLSIVDETWETLDPNPDIRSMFLEFNDTFFWGKLSGVEVKWSPRMTLCAGVCSYEGRGGLCSIRLSEPLLKLRPRRDLVQTLLHEMIHALLFVTQNNRDRDGHGPEFCKHMHRINKASGTKITIYHSFHDEVDVYRQHWWRCNGPCQKSKPYFGYVKRAMNRAPSSLDPWWEDHRRKCGGTYTKVKEPEGYSQKGKKNGKTTDKAHTNKASGSGKNSSTSAGSGSQDIRNIIPFSGKGFVLGGNSQSSTSSPPFHKPAVPVVKTSSSSPIFPSSQATSDSFLGHSSRDNQRISSPTSSTGKKPPLKRSVGNTRVFVNINGSPVRIPKTHRGSNSSQKATKVTQRSIENLFSNTSSSKSANHSSSANPETKKESVSSSTISATSASSFFPKQQSNQSAQSLTSISKPSVSASGIKGSPTKSTQSKYFSHSNMDSTTGGGGQNVRKRQRDDHNSATIADFFRRTSSSSSSASQDPIKTNSSAAQQRSAPPTTSSSLNTSSLHSSAGLHSVPSSSSTSSSSAVLMVSCPVCQVRVQESKINEHLDGCLS